MESEEKNKKSSMMEKNIKKEGKKQENPCQLHKLRLIF
jgi:hypothetical protein